jgi:hypothetical protein
VSVGAPPLTRRSFLAAGAGALAAGLARPSAPLGAALGFATPRRSERWLGGVPPGAATIALSRGADLLGLEWDAPAGARVQLRLLNSRGRWSEWVSAIGCTACEEAPGLGRAPARVVGSPVWSAGASALQLRATRALEGVRLHVVDVSGGIGAHRLALLGGLLGPAGARAASATQLEALPGQPAILPRAVWAQGMARPRVAPAYGKVQMAFVHHTETPNGYLAAEVPAMLRAIFTFHRDVKGWNDIGYNFVIDAFGRVFEARAGGVDEPVVGAQAGGFNLVSTGVAVLGAFSSQPPPAAAAHALQALLAWKLSLHGVPAQGRARVRVNPAGAIYTRFRGGARVWLPHIAGHRDGDSTDCPGDAFYHQLPALRRGVRALAPAPALATLALIRSAAPAPAAPAGTPPVPAAQPEWSLTGSLALLDGSPIAGAAIKLQVRHVAAYGEAVSERTLAEAHTDPAGNWSLALGPARRAGAQVWLRALYPGGGQVAGAGAAVSEPLRVPASLIAGLQAPAPSAPAPAPPAP